jgi:hypothetical protein
MIYLGTKKNYNSSNSNEIKTTQSQNGFGITNCLNNNEIKYLFQRIYHTFYIYKIKNNHWGCGAMVLNATFNNISVISWLSVLLVEETGVPGENHWPVASHWQTLSHNVVSSCINHLLSMFSRHLLKLQRRKKKNRHVGVLRITHLIVKKPD